MVWLTLHSSPFHPPERFSLCLPLALSLSRSLALSLSGVAPLPGRLLLILLKPLHLSQLGSHCISLADWPLCVCVCVCVWMRAAKDLWSMQCLLYGSPAYNLLYTGRQEPYHQLLLCLSIPPCLWPSVTLPLSLSLLFSPFSSLSYTSYSPSLCACL